MRARLLSLAAGLTGVVATTGLMLLTLAACSSSGSPPAGSGGPVSGKTDAHCSGVPPQPTSQADCHVVADGGSTDTGGSDYGATMDNQEGDDDDCKYHVSWTSTPIAENQDVTFTLTGTYKTDGTPNPPACTGCPITGLDTASLYIELGYSDPTHPPPITNQVVTTTTPGTYTIGPVQFDKAGTWTVRFHLFETCTDVADDSPHGHAAFYVQVP